MKKLRITAIRKTCYPDLMEKYENPIQHACEVKEGQVCAQFASTDCPFRMSGAGSSVEAVWVSGRIFYLFSGVRSRMFFPFISRR